jgi:hypothetical protein
MQGTWLFFPAFLQGAYGPPLELLGDISERPSLTALFLNTLCPALSCHQGVLSVLPTAVQTTPDPWASPCPPGECGIGVTTPILQKEKQPQLREEGAHLGCLAPFSAWPGHCPLDGEAAQPHHPLPCAGAFMVKSVFRHPGSPSCPSMPVPS